MDNEILKEILAELKIQSVILREQSVILGEQSTKLRNIGVDMSEFRPQFHKYRL